MKNIFLINIVVCILLSCIWQTVDAQQSQGTISINGTIKDKKGVKLMGVVVSVQETSTFTESDEIGNFSITIPKLGSVLTFRVDYFQQKTLVVSSTDFISVVLDDAAEGQGIEDLVNMPWYQTQRRDLTAAVSTIGYNELRKSPVMSLSNAVSGRLPGFQIRQTGGLPGFDIGSYRVRGMRTLESGGLNALSVGGSGDPLVIVDGFERDFTELDATEIESLSVLKDAAGTALYGMRGANGVILVNTKRGQMNMRTISLNMSWGIVTPTKLPDFLGSFDYASLYNEARKNDNLAPLYTEQDLQLYKDGSSPLTHPDVDYYDEFIKDYASQRKVSLNMNGGNKIVRYYVALAYNSQDGLFKRTNENPDFQTKIQYNRYNLRSNIDINLAKWLVLSADVAGRIEDRRFPYETSGTIMDILSSYPSNAFPLQFEGIHPTLNKKIMMLGGNSLYTQNPVGVLSYNGYNESTKRYYQVSARAKVDLSSLTKGLSFEASYHLDGYNLYNVEKQKNFQVWKYSSLPNGAVSYTPFNTESSLATTGTYDVTRINGIDAMFKYENSFGNHHVSAFVLYNQQRTEPKEANYSDRKWQNYSFRASYSYLNRYFLDVVGSYMGSDNFYWTNNPRLFYPAVSGAWILSDEPFMKGTKKWLDNLKLRASYGVSGNDRYNFTDVNGNEERYPSRVRWWTYSTQQYFGTALTSVVFIKEGRVANPNLTVEKANMLNIALESSFLSHRLSFGIDYWREKRSDIYTVGVGSMPWMLGVVEARLPILNEGIIHSSGFEASLGWKDHIGNLFYRINGYADIFDSSIDYMAEPYKEFENLVQTGKRVLQDYGLVAKGLFKDQADISSSPVQTFGPYQPGDIKYEDLNGDNIIDANDMTSIGNGSIPRLNYAIDIALAYKGFDLLLLFQGAGLRSTYLSNRAIRAFYDNGKISSLSTGRFQTYEDGNNNWSEATYPRLTTISNDNNWRASTYWMRDASYMRLKNIELGYTIPDKLTKKVKIYGARIYINAYNALTFTKLKDFDPEDTAAGITRYPQTKIFNFGINLKF